MLVQITTDHDVEGKARLQVFLEYKISNVPSRFKKDMPHLTVCLSSENGVAEIRCLLNTAGMWGMFDPRIGCCYVGS